MANLSIGANELLALTFTNPCFFMLSLFLYNVFGESSCMFFIIPSSIEAEFLLRCFFVFVYTMHIIVISFDSFFLLFYMLYSITDWLNSY